MSAQETRTFDGLMPAYFTGCTWRLYANDRLESFVPGLDSIVWRTRRAVVSGRLLLMRSASKSSYGKNGSKTHTLAASIGTSPLSSAADLL